MHIPNKIIKENFGFNEDCDSDFSYINGNMKKTLKL